MFTVIGATLFGPASRRAHVTATYPIPGFSKCPSAFPLSWQGHPSPTCSTWGGTQPLATLPSWRSDGHTPGIQIRYLNGCGDGAVAAEALKLGSSVVCIERDPTMAELARDALQSTLNSSEAATMPEFFEAVPLFDAATVTEHDPWMAEQASAPMPSTHRAAVITSDIFEVPLQNATIVFLFMTPSVNARMRAKLTKQLRPGARVLSREYEILGWPCGERFRHGGALFLLWEMPVPSSEHAIVGVHAAAAAGDELEHDDELQQHDSGLEDAVIEHQLECAADEAVS